MGSRNLVGAALLLGCACASPDAELHVAPIYSRHTLPGYDYAEAAGGVLRYGEQGGAVTWALSPLVWRRAHGDGAVEADFFYPLGRYEHDPERPRTYARLFPVFWREAETRPDGVEDIDWSFLFPFFWGGSSSDGRENYFAFFPVIGTLRDFLTYDQATFVLFPLYLHNEKDQRKSTHLFWPIVGWQTGSERGWRVFPLYGEAEVPGMYKRSYALWPIFHRSANELYKEQPRQGWFVLPLAGRIRQDDYVATSVWWPIFGVAERPSTGYHSWQVWPLLKFERGGQREHKRRSQLLPLWLRFENEETEYSSLLFPLLWWRHDRFAGSERESFYAVPLFWQSRTTRPDGRSEQRTRLWPLARHETDGAGGQVSTVLAPGIEPLLNSEALSRNLGFLFELWAIRDGGTAAPRVQRSFLNLYHSAAAAGHRRWSIPFLAGQWREPDGTIHTSLLLGLIRFRSGPGGGFEEPAFPGPGWPDLHRVAAESTP